MHSACVNHRDGKPGCLKVAIQPQDRGDSQSYLRKPLSTPHPGFMAESRSSVRHTQTPWGNRDRRHIPIPPATHNPERLGAKASERNTTMAIQQRLPRFLGLFSTGLGIAQVASPRGFTRFIGVGDNATNQGWVRLAGVRDIMSGAGLLSSRRPTGWMVTRLGGDAMDLALLRRALTAGRDNRPTLRAALTGRRGRRPGLLAALTPRRRKQPRLLPVALTSRGNVPPRLLLVTAVAAGIAVLDVGATIQQMRRPRQAEERAQEEKAIKLKKTVTVDRPPEELYRFWRDFQNLPHFMRHLAEVQPKDQGLLHWKTKAPAGRIIEWDTKIVEDRPNEMIAWRSVEGSPVANAGSVRFIPAPGGRGTWVQLELEFEPPGGRVGALLARVLSDVPEQLVEIDLRAFKALMEAGEVIVSDATLNDGLLRQRPAQPAPDGARTNGARTNGARV